MKVVFLAALKAGYETVKHVAESRKDEIHVFTLDSNHSGRSGYVPFDDLEGKCKLYKIEPKDDSWHNKIKNLNPEVIFVIGWSFIIPQEIISAAKHGAIGQHPTLLPKHRGNAPIPWTLINGLTRTGVSLFYLTDEADAGDIVAQSEIEVLFEDDAASLYNKMIETTKKLFVETLDKIENNSLEPWAQDAEKASKWPKRKPEDGIIDWDVASINIYNWIRGLTHPYPGAFTFLENKKIFIWKSSPGPDASSGKPGEIMDTASKILVKAGDGSVYLEKLQIEGEEELSAEDFVKKYGLVKGVILG